MPPVAIPTPLIGERSFASGPIAAEKLGGTGTWVVDQRAGHARRWRRNGGVAHPPTCLERPGVTEDGAAAGEESAEEHGLGARRVKGDGGIATRRWAERGCRGESGGDRRGGRRRTGAADGNRRRG